MRDFLWRIAQRFAEIIGIVTALVFVFELTTANRSLPVFDAQDPDGIGALEFFERNNRSIVYLSLILDRENLREDSADGEETIYDGTISFEGVRGQNGAIGILDWESLSNSYLAVINDDRAEDISLGYFGPAYVRLYEEEGLQYVELSAAPYTDSVSDQTRCTEQLMGAHILSFAYRYVAGCMFKLISPPSL